MLDELTKKIIHIFGLKLEYYLLLFVYLEVEIMNSLKTYNGSSREIHFIFTRSLTYSFTV